MSLAPWCGGAARWPVELAPDSLDSTCARSTLTGWASLRYARTQTLL